jgi:hypothetical protein
LRAAQQEWPGQKNEKTVGDPADLIDHKFDDFKKTTQSVFPNRNCG